MAWFTLATAPAPAFPSESWASILLPPVEGLKLYAFKISTGDSIPADWGTIGFWGLGQQLGDRRTVGRTWPIPFPGRDTDQALVAIGAGAVDFVIQDPLDVYLYYSIHRWMPRSTIYLYGWS